MMEAIEAVGKVEAGAEIADPKVRRIDAIEVGLVVRQGDIYLVRIENGHRPGKLRKDHQLAPGATMGSRHVATGERVKVYEPGSAPPGCGVDPRALLGPVIVAEGRCLVTHPEHAHVDLPPGTYQVVHQLDARTRQRVQD